MGSSPHVAPGLMLGIGDMHLGQLCQDVRVHDNLVQGADEYSLVSFVVNGQERSSRPDLASLEKCPSIWI